jgi:hypothetical protein
MRFGFGCPQGHEVIEQFSVGHAPDAIVCPDHGFAAARVFDVPYMQEDRRHMRSAAPTQNAPTEDWSWSLGGPRPKSRSEMRILEKSRGIEFVSPQEARADAAKLRAGKNLDEPVRPEKGYLAKEIARRGIRFDRSLTPQPTLTREQAERKLADTRPDWGDSHGSEAKDVSSEKVSAP